MSFPFYRGAIPRITTLQMVEVDHLMVEVYGISLMQMMENAGRALATLARSYCQKTSAEPIVVLAGTGGNGGGVLVAARRLAAWGFPVEVYVSHPDRMSEVPAHQLGILQQMEVPIGTADDLSRVFTSQLILDGIIGYSLNGSPRGAAKKMIDWAEHQVGRVLSLDTPSGVDLTAGTLASPTIHATATLTLALPKVGLFAPEVLPYRGVLYLADISVPPQLYLAPSLGIQVGPIFRAGDILEID